MRSIIPIILIIASLGIFFLFVSPTYGDVSSLRANTVAYNNALTNSTQLQKVRDSLLSSYNSITDTDKNRLSDSLPNTVDNIQLILQLQQIASNHGMSLNNISFDTPTSDPNAATGASSTVPYGVFNLEFKTQGTYDTFVSFLHDLEQNLRIIDINSISFTVPPQTKNSSTNATDPNVYQYDIKIQTYWLK